jgi:cysteinyl-tRNA synthetase
MPLRIYNSLSKKKEEFQPIEPGVVKMYVCGPTVYDEPHIGHLRSAYVFEVIRNFFKDSGYKVKFVRNVTDIDDKIIDKAKETAGAGKLSDEVKSVSTKYLQLYNDDLDQLGIKPPDAEPKATDHIPGMIALIQRLIEKGCAYSSGGDVYFDIKCFKNYGKLSHQNLDAMIEGVRIDPSEKKRNPLDFALWKKTSEEEGLNSPWGWGRPGWHIECSAMNYECLGEQVDIHGGGLDLIFPHHENEIAQSECVTGKSPFARYWVHHGLITINGHKMSKSLKNFVTLSTLPNREGREIEAMQELKLLFLGTHYTAPLDFTEEKMIAAKAVRERFFFFFKGLRKLEGRYPDTIYPDLRYLDMFKRAMDDDFNTPQALAVMHQMVDDAWKGSDQLRLSIGRTLERVGDILMLFPLQEIRGELAVKDQERVKWVEGEIAKRTAARKNKDFKAGDEIRNRLKETGVELQDLPDGNTEWRFT